MRSALENSTALSGGKSLVKVVRARIHAKELIDCGFDPTKPDEWNRVLKPILRAKKVPERLLLINTPCRVDATEGGLTLEWDDKELS